MINNFIHLYCMEKRKDVKIFMLCDHRVDFLVDDEVITPLECGADVKDNDVCKVKDNTGDNISAYNEFYLENTGVYWIWKNVKGAKYKGQTQYRRQFRGLSYLDFDKVFSNYDVIVADPLDLPKTFKHPTCTVEFHYKVAHNIRDLNILKEIIEEWQRNNPSGSKNQCIRETGISKPTVYKWWFDKERVIKRFKSDDVKKEYPEHYVLEKSSNAIKEIQEYLSKGITDFVVLSEKDVADIKEWQEIKRKAKFYMEHMGEDWFVNDLEKYNDYMVAWEIYYDK